ncbi:MAG: hypothetical protein F4190_00750 [Acidimicrobiales bacterium]|nr:hypothetical protein [Acidimicrobiales bacterium]MYG87042.1 hypothetical protein [Acidimicrobiales bacterium]MYI27004.1 hypothetical protein [Acidimicrobiales bacterium]
MPNATPRDARAGFEIFRRSSKQMTLDELNHRLVSGGHRPVSPRTYRHYASLISAGYNRYLSINRFELSRSYAPYENASSMARYDYKAVDIAIRMMMDKSRSSFEIEGFATRLGDFGSIVEIRDSTVHRRLDEMRPRVNDKVMLHYSDVGLTVNGRLVDVDLSAVPAHLEIENSRITPVASIVDGVVLETSLSRFTLRDEFADQQTTDQIAKQLYYFFELLEGLRSIVNLAYRIDSPTYAPPAQLAELQIASPTVVVVEIVEQLVDLFPWGMAAVILSKIWGLPEKRKTWYEGSREKLQFRLFDHESEVRQLELDVRRKEAELRSRIIDAALEAFSDEDLSLADVQRVLDRDLLPNLRELGRIGVSAIEAVVEQSGQHSSSDANRSD